MSGRILVLDDEENYAEMLQDLLLQNNYRVDMVTRPERAIDRLEEIRYDLVVSDYKMPVMDGADFLKRAREIYPDLPFILVSGLMNTPELVKVANMSVTLVLEKPLDTDLFLEHVSRFSKPMSAEELRDYKASGGGGRPQAADDLPDPPSYYSALCRASKTFLGDFWKLANRSSVLVVVDEKGGDAENALRDLSIWKGQREKEIVRLILPRILAVDAPLVLEEIVKDESKSNVVHVSGAAFNAKRDIEKIVRLEERTLSKVREGDRLSLVIVLPRTAENGLLEEAFPESFSENVLTNFGLRSRLPDLASYVRQQLISADSPPRFSQDSIYALLSHPWPDNLVELRQVIGRVVAGGGEEAVSLERLSRAMGARGLAAVAGSDRMDKLLRLCQGEILRDAVKGGLAGVAGVESEFGVSLEAAGTEGRYEEVPLIKPELAKL